MADKTTIIIQSPDGQKSEIVLDACIFGGVMGDGSGYPVGGYSGDLDVSNTGTSLVHILRAFIKVCEEQKMNQKQIEGALDFFTKEALSREGNKDPLDNVDLDTHMIKIRKDQNKEG